MASHLSRADEDRACPRCLELAEQLRALGFDDPPRDGDPDRFSKAFGRVQGRVILVARELERHAAAEHGASGRGVATAAAGARSPCGVEAAST